MKESRSEFDANEILATSKPVPAAKGDWTRPSPNRFRNKESLFDRVLKVLFPIRGV